MRTASISRDKPVSIASDDVQIFVENAIMAVELRVTVPVNQHQSELQAKNTRCQLEAMLKGQKIKELMEEGKKITLEMDKLRVELVLAQ